MIRIADCVNPLRFSYLAVHDELTVPAQVFGQQRAFQVAAERVLRRKTQASPFTHFLPRFQQVHLTSFISAYKHSEIHNQRVFFSFS